VGFARRLSALWPHKSVEGLASLLPSLDYGIDVGIEPSLNPRRDRRVTRENCRWLCDPAFSFASRMCQLVPYRSLPSLLLFHFEQEKRGQLSDRKGGGRTRARTWDPLIKSGEIRKPLAAALRHLSRQAPEWRYREMPFVRP
jgi:hypothetical protein